MNDHTRVLLSRADETAFAPADLAFDFGSAIITVIYDDDSMIRVDQDVPLQIHLDLGADGDQWLTIAVLPNPNIWLDGRAEDSICWRIDRPRWQECLQRAMRS